MRRNHINKRKMGLLSAEEMRKQDAKLGEEEWQRKWEGGNQMLFKPFLRKIAYLIWKKKTKNTVDVQEHWLFIAGTRDDWELEGLYWNALETFFVPFVPSKQDLAALGKLSSYHFESIEKFCSTSLTPNEALLDWVRSVVFILGLKRRTDHSM